MSLEDKKKFLVNNSVMYRNLIKLTENECLRRFLAFRIILDAMCYEDLINNRSFNTLRTIRDALLAHKQKYGFFEGFSASEHIVESNINSLIEFMTDNLDDSSRSLYFKEVRNIGVSTRLEHILGKVLNNFDKEYYSGYRISNNFLCTISTQIQEISSSELAGVFYRYNSSKELGAFYNCLFTNIRFDFELQNAVLGFKADFILHCVNMHDCIFKDTHNRYSIDGLYEIMESDNIGHISYRDNLLKTKTDVNDSYRELRKIRNHCIGHIDRRMNLDQIIKELDEYDIQKAFDFINKLDGSVLESTKAHIAISIHASLNTAKISDPNIIEVKGIENVPFYDN